MANSGGSLVDKRQLDAETDDDCKHQQDDEELKGPETAHGAIRLVEEQDNHDVEDRQSTACHKRDLRDE